MARSLRIERAGGLYHVINRGNYRQDLFTNEGAHRSFEQCLFEACEKSGWVLEGICDVDGLADYRWSSYWYLQHPKSRPEFLDTTGALWHAGELPDTSSGRRKYAQYLKWLVADVGAQKEMAFEKMCRGWALGGRKFKQEALKTEGLLKDGDFKALRLEGQDLEEANELIWESLLERGLNAVGESEESARLQKKSADWKVWIAAELKRRTNAPNAWIAQRLHMGVPHAVTIHLGKLDSGNPGYLEFLKNCRK